MYLKDGREIYESEAKTINDIQKGILAILMPILELSVMKEVII